MLQIPQNFSALECTLQNTEKECCTTTGYQKDKKLNWYQCFAFLKVVLNTLENAQSLPWLQCVPVIFENTCGRQASKMAPKISHSPGVHALHNPWHGQCDGFYSHAYVILHGAADLKIRRFIQWPDLIT